MIESLSRNYGKAEREAVMESNREDGNPGQIQDVKK
jgi:hypothetical protein